MSNLISNFIKKIEFEPNFKVVELEFEPKPCDIDHETVQKPHKAKDKKDSFDYFV